MFVEYVISQSYVALQSVTKSITSYRVIWSHFAMPKSDFNVWQAGLKRRLLLVPDKLGRSASVKKTNRTNWVSLPREGLTSNNVWTETATIQLL